MRIDRNLEVMVSKLNDTQIDYLGKNFNDLRQQLNDVCLNSNLFNEVDESSSITSSIFLKTKNYSYLRGFEYEGLEVISVSSEDDTFFNSGSIGFDHNFQIKIFGKEGKIKSGLFRDSIDLSNQYPIYYTPLKSIFKNPDWNNVNREEYDPNSKFYLNYNELIEWEDKRKSKFDLNDDERGFICSINKKISDFLITIDSKLNESKKSIVEVKQKVNVIISQEFDINQDGELDILNGDNLLVDLLNKHQSTIVEFDHSLIQKIIKLNNFLKVRKSDLNMVFELLKGVETDEDLEKMMGILRLGIKNTNSILVLSLEMIVSIKDKELVTFYEIYESFDRLGVFNSNWENEVTSKLSSIDSKLSSVISSLKDVMFSINSMEKSITSSINNLTYVTSHSYQKLQSSVTNELKSIRSGVQWNNLLTGIQTYQTYKLRKSS